MIRSLIYLLILTSVTACSHHRLTSIPPQKPQRVILVKSNEAFKVNSDKRLPFYVQSSMHELISNTKYVKPQSVIAVTSFVYIDSDFNTTPLFAQQIKESFIYEFHKLNQPVIEIRASGLIRVTKQGEFFLSKDYRQLRVQQPVDYLLVGTISRLKDGVMLNTRLVGAESFSIVGASQLFIPTAVIENFVSSSETSRPIKLIKG